MLQTRNNDFVRTLTLDRAKALNAFNGALFDALTEELLAAGGDDTTRVVVLTGTGRAFSAGLDLTEVGVPTAPPQARRSRPLPGADRVSQAAAAGDQWPRRRLRGHDLRPG